MAEEDDVDGNRLPRDTYHITDDEADQEKRQHSISYQRKRSRRVDLLCTSANDNLPQQQVEPGSKTTIDDLPQVTILSILSRLPLKEVIKTSILSRSWRPLWTSVPFLHLDFNWVNDIESDRPKQLICYDILKHVFDFHEASIQGCRITDVSADLQTDMEEKVFDDLKAKGVQELRFSYDTTPDRFISGCLFHISSLTSLYLHQGIICLRCDQFQGLPNLEKLVLKEMKFNSRSFQNLVGGCESLNALTVDRCSGFRRLIVQNNSLKSMEIREDAFVETDLVEAINIECFVLNVSDGHCWGVDGCLLMKTMKALVHVKKVYISFGTLQACSHVDSVLHKERFQFSLRQLAFLDIQMAFTSIYGTELICRLFECVPNLQKLIIQLDVPAEDHSADYWRLGMPFMFQTHSLQTVTIKEFKGTIDLDLATFFLRYSRVLKHMAVHFQSSMSECAVERFRDELQGTAEAESSAAKLEFL